jgi:hypothetical protein
MRPYLKNSITKKGLGGVAQGIGPEFKQYPPKKKKLEPLFILKTFFSE